MGVELYNVYDLLFADQPPTVFLSYLVWLAWAT